MTVNAINGISFGSLSAVSNKSLSALTAINGQLIALPSFFPDQYMYNIPRLSPILGKSNSLTKGLVFATFPGGPRRYDMIGGGLGVTDEPQTFWDTIWDTTNQYTAPGNGFFARKTTGDTARYYWPWSDNIASVTTDCTVIAWVLLTSFTAAAVTHLFNFPYRTDGSWTAPFRSLGLARASGATGMSFSCADAGTLVAVASDTGMLATDGLFNLLGATRSGTSVIFYKNGLQHGASKTLGTAAAVDWGQHSAPTLMNRASNANGEAMAGYCFFLGLWSRVLSADEMNRFYVNPFQIVPGGALY